MQHRLIIRTVGENLLELSKKFIQTHQDAAYKKGDEIETDILKAKTKEQKEKLQKRLEKRNRGLEKVSKRLYGEETSKEELRAHIKAAFVKRNKWKEGEAEGVHTAMKKIPNAPSKESMTLRKASALGSLWPEETLHEQSTERLRQYIFKAKDQRDSGDAIKDRTKHVRRAVRLIWKRGKRIEPKQVIEGVLRKIKPRIFKKRKMPTSKHLKIYGKGVREEKEVPKPLGPTPLHYRYWKNRKPITPPKQSTDTKQK